MEMMMGLTLNDFATIIGLLFGVVGSVLGVLSHFNDRAKVIVTLKWDMTIIKENESPKLVGVISIANIGRRPICISHVALTTPKKYNGAVLLIKKGLKWQTLNEGDPMVTHTIDHSEMESYAKDNWKEIIARVEDTSGKVWTSSRWKNKKKPSWAK